jgi:predicted permease
MSEQTGRDALPPEITEVVERVLDASGLDFVDGRAEVEQELFSHFEDGLAAGSPAHVLIERFGDPLAAGRRIARTRPRAAARNRGEHWRWWMSPRELWDEMRQAARRLGRAPGFTVIVILTLALGVGANTAIFAVLNAVLLEELPYAEPGRLVRVYENNRERPQLQFIRAPVLAEWKRWEGVFEHVGGLYTYREVGADLTSGSSPRRVTVMRASTGYFETLGVAPERGRTFEFDESLGPGEATSTTTPPAFVTVLSHDLWTSEYEGASDLIGRTIELDGTSFEVVGVTPRGFNNPFGTHADVWVPQDLRSGGSNSFGNYYLSAVGRLRDGLTLEVAQERLKTLAEAFAEQEPRMQAWFPTILPLQDDLVGDTRRTMLLILAGAAGLVLLTACVNVANLLFARGLGRDRDLALRSAIGSSRGRLIAGILAENGLLAAGGGLFGLLIGWSGVKALLWLAPDALPMVAEVELGSTVFLFALTVTVAALVIFGLVPALRLSRTAPADVLRSGDRASTVGRVSRRLRDALVML